MAPGGEWVPQEAFPPGGGWNPVASTDAFEGGVLRCLAPPDGGGSGRRYVVCCVSSGLLLLGGSWLGFRGNEAVIGEEVGGGR